ncbi:DUF4199 domain-containing protein [uncultured Polaribacter sp.]|uniref:DUF4199 domain-containing protein n=1 Tax=uncultured Polaribacter sp. TaxID=174711 RepID=UPI002615CE5F|nr:DUF4199 domain-containing protein [uncultured Polaribacter sp.]
MENQVSSKSIIINQGLYLGIVSILINLVVYALGNHLQPHWSVSVIFFVVLTGFIVMGMKQFKSSNGGFMSWGEAVKIGVGLTMISAVIVTIYNQIFMNFIEPDLMQQMSALQEQQWIDAGLSSDQIENSKKMMEKFQGPVISSAVGLVASAFFGFIVSAIAGAVMKESAEEQY